MEKIIIRPSSLATYINCPYKWYLQNVEGIQVIPKPVMVLGTAVHKGAEVGYTEKIQKGNLPPVDVLTDAAVEEFREKIKEADTTKEEDFNLNDYEKRVVTDVVNYRQNIMPYTQPKAVEKFYRLELSSKAVEAIQGTADIILQDNTIADIKVTLRKAQPKHYIMQLSTYALLIEKLDNVEVKKAEIHNIVDTKLAAVLPLELHKKQVKYIINNLIDTLEVMQEGKVAPEILFKGNPQSFLCDKKYCDFYDKCPFVKGKIF